MFLLDFSFCNIVNFYYLILNGRFRQGEHKVLHPSVMKLLPWFFKAAMDHLVKGLKPNKKLIQTQALIKGIHRLLQANGLVWT